MTAEQAVEQAKRLGLSTWIAHAMVAGPEGKEDVVELMCVGFASAGLSIAEGETWDEALDEAVRIIFAP